MNWCRAVVTTKDDLPGFCEIEVLGELWSCNQLLRFHRFCHFVIADPKTAHKKTAGKNDSTKGSFGREVLDYIPSLPTISLFGVTVTKGG